MSVEFEWDLAKAEENKRQHGVTFEEAATVFGDPFARIFDDPEHSSDDAERSSWDILKGSVYYWCLSPSGRPRFGSSVLALTRGERQRHEQNVKKAAQEPS
jgi:hypothetical protein